MNNKSSVWTVIVPMGIWLINFLCHVLFLGDIRNRTIISVTNALIKVVPLLLLLMFFFLSNEPFN